MGRGSLFCFIVLCSVCFCLCDEKELRSLVKVIDPFEATYRDVTLKMQKRARNM